MATKEEDTEYVKESERATVGSDSVRSENDEEIAAAKTKEGESEAAASGKDLPPDLSKEELLACAKREFNKERKIIIRNVPPVTYEEVKEFIGGHGICNIVISKKSRHAVVTLLNGEDAELIVEELSAKQLLDTDVTVALHPSDKKLCLANLPRDCTDEEIREFLGKFGVLEQCFLMRSPHTGDSKGYAIFEYCHNKEKSAQICNELSWREYRSASLLCDFIDQNLMSYEKLNSRCLLVSNLPVNYRNSSELRQLFSEDTDPIYCQIVIKDGEPTGYAIIEYSLTEDAEAAFNRIQGRQIEEKEVKVTFCIPGKTAVNLYHKVIQKLDLPKTSIFQTGSAGGAKSGLLPDPVFPNPAMMNSLLVQGLTTQNPKLMQDFMQALQALQQSYIHQTILRNAKPGLLGPGPNMSLNPLMNPNMQLGLIILLALQMHGQQKQFTGPLAKQLNMLTSRGQHNSFQAALQGQKPSLLGDPVTAQANILVQNLMSQLNTESRAGDDEKDKDVLHAESVSTGKETCVIPPGTLPASVLSAQAQRLRNLNLNWLISLGQLVSSMQSSSVYGQNSADLQGGTDGILGNSPPPVVSASASSQGGHWSPAASVLNQSLPSGKPGLLPNPNSSTGSGFNQNMAAAANFMKNLQVLAAAQHLASSSSPPSSSKIEEQPQSAGGTSGVNLNSLFGDNSGQMSGAGGGKRQFNSEPSKRAGLLPDPQTFGGRQHPEMSSYGSNRVRGASRSGSVYSGSYSNQGGQDFDSFSDVYNNNGSSSSSSSSQSSYNSAYFNNTQNSTYQGNYDQYNDAPSTSNQSKIFSYGLESTSYAQTMTTMGQKRSYNHLLPSPEPSPEGSYIGQHSQGIGGHYADSYVKRKRYDTSIQRPPVHYH